jgi:GNAT superfamily N-acetyltransferase
MTLSDTSPAISTPGPHEAIRFLLRDRIWSAYPLGYLDPSSDIQSQIWISGETGATSSLVMLSQLPQLVSIFASGDRLGISRLLGDLPAAPASGVFSVMAGTLETLERHFYITTAYSMRRMRIAAQDFRPRRTATVSRLGIDDLDAVKRIYGMWTDNHQLPSQLARGIYFGVYHGAELIAIAGTHCISKRYGVGAIGNVLTNSGYRNQGLASTTTTAVAEELFAMGCEEVILKVRQGNDMAYALYQSLGFTNHCSFVEGVFHARLGRS